MNNWGTEFRVGVFTLLGLAVTIFAIFVLNPDLFDTEKKSHYFTVLKDASGIMPKTHVKTNGVTVGKVQTVELGDNATKVGFEIKADVRIPKGSTIEIRTVGFLGDKFLEIKRVDDKGDYIAVGDLIPRSTDTAELNEVVSTIGKVAEDIRKVTNNLAKVLGDDKAEKSMQNIMDNIEQFTVDARGILQDNREDVRTLVANLQEFSKSVNDVLDKDNKEKIDRIIARFDTTMESVDDASKNIKLIAAKVEKGEGTLGKLINDEDTIEEINGAIKEVRNVLAPVSNLQVAVDYHGEFRRDQSTQHYFNVNFQTRPNHFYILGFTDRGKEQIDTSIDKTVDTDPTDNISYQREIRETQRPIRFNLQFGRRWYWAAVRFGLFETTGGVAADFYLFRDHLKWSVEAFDFADKDDKIRKTAHFKSYLSALFFNHIYAMVGVDDPTRYDPKTFNPVTGKAQLDKKLNTFFGAGITFNDQDLKALFGVAAIAAGGS